MLNILGKIYGAELRNELIDESLFGDGFNLKEAVKISKSHSLGALLAIALEKTQYFTTLSSDIQKAISTLKLSSMKKSICFDSESSALYDEFNKQGIDFMPLKGIIIKELYPEIGMREFADHDILIRRKDAKAVKHIFASRNYKIESYGKSHHDVYEKLPFYNYEIHRCLFDDGGVVSSKYFKNVWDKAANIGNHRYELNENDCYIYILAHAFKHLENSGNGLRYLLDIYVIERAWKDKLDHDYIRKEMATIDMLEFYETSLILAKKFLNEDNESLSDEENVMLNKIFLSGTYGTIEHRVENQLKKKSKFRYFLSRAFMPWSSLKMFYPFIAYTFIFIPFFWAWRLIYSLIFKFSRVKAEIDAIKKN
ncbi:MAG: nucleotidyltransferase family protein [Bacilli bacterium]|nr:nucleotidyltransferase family protein [Bacilli bacterium]